MLPVLNEMKSLLVSYMYISVVKREKWGLKGDTAVKSAHWLYQMTQAKFPTPSWWLQQYATLDHTSSSDFPEEEATISAQTYVQAEHPYILMF